MTAATATAEVPLELSPKRTALETLSTLGLPHASLEFTGPGGEPELDETDLALASQGVPEVPYAAFMYVFRHDIPSRGRLYAWLLNWTIDTAERERWGRAERDPATHRVRPETLYLEKMVLLALAEALHPRQAGNANLRALWWRTQQGESRPWDGHVARCYEAVWQSLQDQLGIASRMISRNANRRAESG